jgi:hypothetical protein
MRQRVKRFNNKTTWKQYEEQNHHEDLNFSKIGTINEDESDYIRDSQYEYGSMLEEHNLSNNESYISSAGARAISKKQSIKNSNSKIERDSELDTDAKYRSTNKTKSNKKLSNISSKESPALVSSSFNTKQTTSCKVIDQTQTHLANKTSDTKINSLRTRLIDKSNVVNKSKPIRHKPLIEIGSDDSDIYDGETTEFDMNDNDEFIEEVFEYVDTSHPSQSIIKEVRSDEETSYEFAKSKVSTVKNYKLSQNDESILDHIPEEGYNLPYQKNNNYNHLSYNNKNRNGYSNFIKGNQSYKSRLVNYENANDINSTLENKYASTSPDNYQTLDPRETKASQLNDSFEHVNQHVNQHRGDTDVLSQSEVPTKVWNCH